MKLWTWQTPDFRLFDGRVDHNRSYYYQTVEGVPSAYKKLAELIGTNQLIWCYTVPDQRIVLPCHTEVELILDVPRESILAFVDEVVWNRILGIRCELPSGVWRPWRDDGRRSFPGNVAAQNHHEAKQRGAYWTQPPPGENWWDSLFAGDRAEECVSALVPHPVAKEWVVVDPIHGC